jgi:antitoxin (DNA-binding transcriptional repressor) of toxin-antitoxin stability system
MKEVAIDKVQAGLLEYLHLAEEEEILITCAGKPVGLLVGFQSQEDWEDYQLENDPHFLKRIADARQRLRAGQGIRLEDMTWDEQ